MAHSLTSQGPKNNNMLSGGDSGGAVVSGSDAIGGEMGFGAVFVGFGGLEGVFL